MDSGQKRHNDYDNNFDTIQIMQLWRMMELSMCSQSSTLTQTDLLPINILGQCKNIYFTMDSEEVDHIVFQTICKW